MLRLVKNVLDEKSGKERTSVIEVKLDGSALLYVDKCLVRKYKRLDTCLVENKFYEFLSKEYDYDEYRD